MWGDNLQCYKDSAMSGRRLDAIPNATISNELEMWHKLKLEGLKQMKLLTSPLMLHHKEAKTPRRLQTSAPNTSTCSAASDGDSDDGGPGSEYNGCAYGTDYKDYCWHPNLLVRLVRLQLRSRRSGRHDMRHGVRGPIHHRQQLRRLRLLQEFDRGHLRRRRSGHHEQSGSRLLDHLGLLLDFQLRLFLLRLFLLRLFLLRLLRRRPSRGRR